MLVAYRITSQNKRCNAMPNSTKPSQAFLRRELTGSSSRRQQHALVPRFAKLPGVYRPRQARHATVAAATAYNVATNKTLPPSRAALRDQGDDGAAGRGALPADGELCSPAIAAQRQFTAV